MSDEKLEVLIAQLQAENPKQRLKACQELAKLGDPSAVIALANTYENDPDAKVRAAAEKTLRRFAISEGGRARSVMWRIFSGLLTLSLLGLIVLNVVLRLGSGDPAEESATRTPTPAPLSRAELIASLTTDNIFPTLDAFNALQERWNGTPNPEICADTISIPSARTLSPIEAQDNPDILPLIDLLNEIETQLSAINTDWEAACTAGSTSPEEIAAAQTALDQTFELINQAVLTIETLPDEPLPTPTPAATSTPTPLPTATITPTPEPTMNPSVLRDIDTRISNTRATANGLLTQNWQVVQAGNQPVAGCRVVSTVSADYANPPSDAFETEPELGQIIALLNESLALVRTSISEFETACRNNSYTPEMITANIQALNSVNRNFDIIEQQLAGYRQGQ